MSNPLRQLHELGQSFWYDNIRRSMLTSGEFQRMVSEDGLRGLTSNPTIFEKAIASSSDYDQAIAESVARGADAEEIFFDLAVEDIQGVAGVLRPIYEESGGADGFASLELPPALARDTQGSIEEARRLFARLGRPNVMIKVPGTAEGIPAMEALIGEGLNINVTLLFSCDNYEQVAEAYIGGLEHLSEKGGDLSKVASVASFFVSRVDKKCDKIFEDGGHEDLLGTVGIANAKDAYRRFQRIFSSERFERLRAKGARVQRCLWASTSTKDPRFSDVLYAENLIGDDTVDTLPDATINAFRDHGRARPTLTEGVDEALALIARLPQLGVDLDRVTAELQDEGVDAFASDFEKLLDSLAQKREALRSDMAAGVRRRRARLGGIAHDVEEAVRSAADHDVARRVWEGDATLWSDDPHHKEVVANRLGWLSVHERMEHRIDALRVFAEQVRDEGTRHAVVLGMGGSSLCPEVLRRSIGSAPGYPELIVLDSTDPRQVTSVRDVIDPARTLFVVSSKSGTTLEPNEFYAYFRKVVDDGSHFVAITDPDTELADLARRERFRKVFLNPPDIGGRYSALSYFGLVPAALMGIDLTALLDRVEDVVCASSKSVPADDNPGLWLGCALGAAQRAGRDKVTLVCPPPIESFGLWVEQLIAESTGKEGTGLIPIAAEPFGNSSDYGDDRIFIALRHEGDGLDAPLDSLAEDGQPVIELFLDNGLDLGREFWRFEFATAVAGHMLGIDPFDEPNVAEAKAATRAILDGGSLPVVPESSPGALIDQLERGDYFALLCYVPYSPNAESVAGKIRSAVRASTKAATTFGYGPRYLHSTGQLHKGGPNTGVFLIVTSGDDEEGFGRLELAQALGDYQTLRAHGRRVARVHVGSMSELDGTIP
jgi:transaldolase / glucose-6-phosphate isomerase